MMKQKNFKIGNIPAVLLGDDSESVYFFVHGQSGYKEEAIDFAKIACQDGWQVVGIDLPKHGERKNEQVELLPWNVIPELTAVIKYLKENWKHISIRATSIGAWFCMLSFAEEPIENSLFVSPILDMEQLIKDMMQWASVSEEQLETEKEIQTDFGETLSWRYYTFAKQHPIQNWRSATYILYGNKDHLTQRHTVDKFVKNFSVN